MLKEMETPTQYRQFSNRIYEAMQNSTFEALAKNLHPVWCEGLAATPDPTWIHPFEIVQLNNDGLFLIIPGNKAIQIAFQILRQFEQRFSSHRYHDNGSARLLPSRIQKACPEPFASLEGKLREGMQRYQNVNLPGIIANQQPALSLSAGLVIADKQVPIHFLEELTAKLLKSAKRKAKALNSQWGYQGSVVDILTLRSLSMVNSEPSLRSGQALNNSRKTARNEKLTMRPYTIYELGGLIRTVQKLKESGIPRAQIFQRREQLHLGKNTSALDYLHFRNSLRGEQIRVLREEIELTWCSNSDEQTLPPWRKVFETELQRQRRLEKGRGDYQPYETILLDIIDMYDFI
jgi:CRISPR-associated protein Cmr2